MRLTYFYNAFSVFLPLDYKLTEGRIHGFSLLVDTLLCLQSVPGTRCSTGICRRAFKRLEDESLACAWLAHNTFCSPSHQSWFRRLTLWNE